MYRYLTPIFVTALVLSAFIGSWMLAQASGSLENSVRIVAFFCANSLLMFDMLDFLARLWFVRFHGITGDGPSMALDLPEISNREASLMLAPYAIIASVHDAADDIDQFIEAMEPFKSVVWLIDDASHDDTLLHLRRQGWRCIAGKTNRKKPGALYELLKVLPAEIETVIVLDPDVRFESASAAQRPVFERVILDFQRSGAAGMTPRIVAHATNWLGDAQALEFELCCGFGRKSLSNVCTSAGVSMYRRSALLRALSQHTLSVYAEDFENSVLLLAAGENIYYDDRLVFVTAAKSTWMGWFSQRVGWSFGWAKVYRERLRQIFVIARRGPLPAYQYVAYLGILGIVALPIKLAGLVVLVASLLRGFADFFSVGVMPSFAWSDPLFFGLCFLKSMLLVGVASCLSARARDRWRHWLTVPFYMFYALAHLIPITVGFLNVIALAVCGRRLYADHYDERPRLHSRRELTATAWSN